MSLYKWGWYVWKDVEWAVYIESIPTMYAAVYKLQCEVMYILWQFF